MGRVHEVALSTQLASAVQRAAHGRVVRKVHVQVGALRQVVPTSLRYAWQFVTKGSTLDGALLDVEWVPAQISCLNGHIRTLDAQEYLDVRCQTCDAPTTVTRGEEFLVVDIEVDK